LWPLSPFGAAGAATHELTLTPFQGKRSGLAFRYSIFKVLFVFSASLCNKKSSSDISRTSTFITIPRLIKKQKNKKPPNWEASYNDAKLTDRSQITVTDRASFF